MKFTFNGYEIDIKARYAKAGDATMNRQDTMAVLNMISSWAYEAADTMDNRNCHTIAKNARDIARDIYDQLDAKGYYDKHKID